MYRSLGCYRLGFSFTTLRVFLSMILGIDVFNIRVGDGMPHLVRFFMFALRGGLLSLVAYSASDLSIAFFVTSVRSFLGRSSVR